MIPLAEPGRVEGCEEFIERLAGPSILLFLQVAGERCRTGTTWM
jgi:hypothetical protein